MELVVVLENLMICEQCGESFKKNSEYNNHLQTHKVCSDFVTNNYSEPPLSPNSGEESDDRDQRRNLASTSQLTPPKDEEGKKNFRKRLLDVTEGPSPKGKNKFVCNICGKIFYSKSHFYEHIQLHTGIKKFGCHICEKKFACESYVTKHRLIHAGHKKFKCDVCGKSFCDRSNHARHKMIHTGEKKFECGVCGKKFVDSSNRAKHEKLHDKNGEN
ncbi:zinc finger protein 454-like [Aethina tumida]|uniref:zinc finger protein 454-like n=1 Tax=Aethina tumida TaxID=116153 RepID=UPI0021481C40|nr:zinc finger protein 454-like [Aethina tumida]